MLLAELLHFGSESAQMAVVYTREEMMLDLEVQSAGEIEAKQRIHTEVVSLLQLMLIERCRQYLLPQYMLPSYLIEVEVGSRYVGRIDGVDLGHNVPHLADGEEAHREQAHGDERERESLQRRKRHEGPEVHHRQSQQTAQKVDDRALFLRGRRGLATCSFCRGIRGFVGCCVYREGFSRNDSLESAAHDELQVRHKRLEGHTEEPHDPHKEHLILVQWVVRMEFCIAVDCQIVPIKEETR